MHVRAQSPIPNPQSPEAGSFTVNSAQDNVAADAGLTLREAMLIANGGTSPGGLNRPITPGERRQLAGCQFILIPPELTAALIIGGCGEAIADTITISPDNTSTASAITLAQALPTLTDNGTTLNGAGAKLNAANIISDSTLGVIRINARNTILNDLAIFNTPNQAADVEILGGSMNTVRNMVLGLNVGATGCNAGATRFGTHGIRIRKEVTGSDAQGAGSVYAYANTIGCHAQAGVWVDGASFVRIGERPSGTVTSNFIGLNPARQPLPNGVGVRVDGGANSAVSNRIVGNYIGGNAGNGIEMIGEPGFGSAAKRVEKTTILSNDIGVDAANIGSGIYLSGTNTNNTIGSTNANERNIISGNGQHGIFAENPTPIAGPDVAMAYIGGNHIGTNLSGTVKLPNRGHGIYLKNASAFIGLLGSAANTLAGNSIAGNAQDGVRIEAGFAFVMANTIGTNLAGANLGNGGDGLSLDSGAAFVGYYPLPGASNTGNRIQFNGQNGLQMSGGEAVIGGNTLAENAQAGVRLGNGANEVKLGLDAPEGYGNLVRGNGSHGIWVSNALTVSISNGTVISNGGYGILMEGEGARAGLISATVAAGNGRDGLAEKNGASRNRWRDLETYGNAGLGIDKAVSDDAANTANKPGVLITTVSKPDAATTRFGGLSTPSATIEVYALAADPTGYGEGRTFLARTIANANGRWQVTAQDAAPLACYTAFETVGDSSSEYSQSSCIKETFLPMIFR
jgi:hypothetical protein